MFYGSGVLGFLSSCWGGQPLVGTNACCLRSRDNPALGCWSSNWGHPLPSAGVDASGCVVSDLHLSRVALHPSLALTGSLIYTHLHSKIVYLSVYPPPLLCLFGAVYYLSVLCYRSSSWRPSVSVYFTLDFYLHPHSFPLFFPISLLSYPQSGLYPLSAPAIISTRQ